MSELTIQPKLDVSKPRDTAIDTVAAFLADKIASERHERSIAASFAHWSDAIRLAGLGPATLDALGELVEKFALEDPVLDDEQSIAQRAVLKAFKKFGPIADDALDGFVTIADHWLPGERLTLSSRKQDKIVFTLTGQVCRDCAMPLAHGDNDSGVQCTDRDQCGWWHCH